eukprot:354617-Chlamydomonas_euryale.AAC.11
MTYSDGGRTAPVSPSTLSYKDRMTLRQDSGYAYATGAPSNGLKAAQAAALLPSSAPSPRGLCYSVDGLSDTQEYGV